MPIRKGIALLVAVLAITAAVFYIFARLSTLSVPLLPKSESAYPWKAVVTSDSVDGGSSVIALKESDSVVKFEFNLSNERSLSWATLSLEFDDFSNPKNKLDWSRYSTLDLMIVCEPNNLLFFSLLLWDEQMSQAGDFSSFRKASTFFECYEDPTLVKIDLTDLTVPEWWLKQSNLPLSDTAYRLDKVLGLAVLNSPQSPRTILSHVTIQSATLEGRNWSYVYAASALLAFIWSGFLFWIARQYARLRIERAMADACKDRPFIPYQQLPIVTRQDKTRSAVINYLAMQYTNPDLGIDTVATALGISRARINETLKDESGLTFSAYLNQLRLVEAARLLKEKDISVSEISCAVGYNNTSYFITVFKKEYGCTPKAFRKQATDLPVP